MANLVFEQIIILRLHPCELVMLVGVRNHGVKVFIVIFYFHTSRFA